MLVDPIRKKIDIYFCANTSEQMQRHNRSGIIIYYFTLHFQLFIATFKKKVIPYSTKFLCGEMWFAVGWGRIVAKGSYFRICFSLSKKKKNQHLVSYFFENMSFKIYINIKAELVRGHFMLSHPSM